MEAKIRVLIVDDHVMFREGIARALATDSHIEIVGLCGSASDALRLLQDSPVDLVLLDYNLGVERGTEFLPEARAAGFSGAVVVVTAGLSDSAAGELIRQGVSAICPKNRSLASLEELIKLAARGVTAIDQRYLKHLVEESPAAPEPFTEREERILRHLVHGLTNKEIATRIGLSEASVKGAMQRLFETTGVRTRSQLVRVVLEHHSDLL